MSYEINKINIIIQG